MSIFLITMSLSGHGFEGLQHQTSEPKQVPSPWPSLFFYQILLLFLCTLETVSLASSSAYITGQGFTGGQQNDKALLSPPLHTCDGESSHTIIPQIYSILILKKKLFVCKHFLFSVGVKSSTMEFGSPIFSIFPPLISAALSQTSSTKSMSCDIIKKSLT